MSKKNYDELASSILSAVGGKENVSSVMHCITRLRFEVKDKSKVDETTLKDLKGTMGYQWISEQLQIIIGVLVPDVYGAVCKLGEFQTTATINENLDESSKLKDKITIKSVWNKILGYISPIMIGILPVMIGAAMCKTIGIVLGPTVLNVISETSDLYLLFNILYDGFFYFLPIYLGYLAAKQLKTNVLLGIYVGAMIIVPSFVSMVGLRETFSVFGISVPVADYGQSFLPVILGVWIMSYVYKLLKKVIPNAIGTVFVPTFTILIMAFVMFGICAPLGSYIGQIIGDLFIMLVDANSIVRLIGYIALGVLFPYIVLGGMHMVLINFAIMTYITNGFEAFVLPVSTGYSFAIYGIVIGSMLKMKKKENKTMALSYATSGLLAGISEPILYGIILKYKSAMKALLIACAISGAYCGIFMPKVYLPGGLVNVFSAVPIWVAGGSNNTISGLVMIVISFLVGVVAAYFMIDFGDD